MRLTPRRTLVLALALVVVFYALQARFTMDDAAISFAYAKALGLLFDLGTVAALYALLSPVVRRREALAGLGLGSAAVLVLVALTRPDDPGNVWIQRDLERARRAFKAPSE